MGVAISCVSPRLPEHSENTCSFFHNQHVWNLYYVLFYTRHLSSHSREENKLMHHTTVPPVGCLFSSEQVGESSGDHCVKAGTAQDHSPGVKDTSGGLSATFHPHSYLLPS